MAGIPFVRRPSRVDEVPLSGAGAGEAVSHWARAKAEDVLSSGEASGPVLGADTMVLAGNGLLGKPGGAEEAARMLERLSGDWHTVVGGVCILYPAAEIDMELVERTRVLFRELSRAEILSYVASGEPMDKAGAYGIQGLGSLLVRRIEGCYFNVMGLPLASMVEALGERLRTGAGGAEER